MLTVISTLVIYYLSQSNLITLLIAIEILLLTVTLQIIQTGGYYDDAYGTLYSLVILIIAGAESAIGLSILVAYYRLRGTIRDAI
uniref:NADH-ubiquinone oxidoreductase chain 4L n=1 Tax=Candida gigantensis TaxID=271359 RepID=S5U5E6_9ASCO|nr:NADH dehydrogenase subunit 4L [Candida gigantensis]YP_008475267.1 NADH dehydrogenase subunit 4L [Candida gigantensis]AGS44588.1 NADH dehydrogenase subunit 4L [Candida gigantensis]AGS44589.1 NADH dehydrogenase subunit 4L [Candida gigantensis]